MKKIFSIVCACLVMMGANAANGLSKAAPRHAAQDDFTYIELPVTYCEAYNLDGVMNEQAGVPWDKGCFLLKFMNVQGEQTQLVFYTYVYTGGSTTNVNADFAMMGIYYDEEAGYVADPGAIALNNKAVYIDQGELNISYRKDVTFNNLSLKEYDFAAYVMTEDGKLYCFSVQVPVLGINKAMYDKDPSAQGVFFATGDKAPLFDAESGSFNETYGEGMFNIVSADQYANYLAEYGCVYLVGENDKTSMSLQFMVGKNASLGTVGIPVGTYPINGTDANGTVFASEGMYQGNPVESYAADYVQEGGKYYVNNYYYIKSGTVVVEDVNGTLKVTVDAVNFNNIPVKAVFEGKSGSPSGDLSGDENADFMATFYNAYWDTNYFQSNGVVYLDADGDMDATKAIALAFFPSTLDQNTVIPVGTYMITNTYEVGTAPASIGYDGSNLWQCYAYTSNDGKNIDKAWFIVSGSISVSRTMQGTSVVVNGKNSKGKNVNVTIISNSTPIENVEAEKVVSKRIENGQVIIRRNGVDYNMMGVAF